METAKKALVVLYLLTVGCSISRERARLVNEIDHFHTQLNLGHFDEIYQQATSKYRRFATLEDNRSKLGTVRKGLGNERQFKIIKMEPHLSPAGRAFFVRCVTEFDKGQAVESFVLISSPDDVRLEVYAIVSPATHMAGTATK